MPTTNTSGMESSLPNGHELPPYNSLTVRHRTDPGPSGRIEECTCFSPVTGDDEGQPDFRTASMFNSAHSTTIHGGTFYLVQGNLSHTSPPQPAHVRNRPAS